MIMNRKNLFRTGLILFFVSMMVSCSKDDENNETTTETGNKTEVYLTDAPIDNADVQGAFITVANVMVNGKAIEGFEKTTIEVSSLTNGDTEFLGDLNLESGTTSNISLVLATDSDASGDSPANYILTSDGEKKELATSTGEITLNDNAEIEESNDNKLILDFDLRKAIKSETEGEYSFASDAELSNSVRAVNALNAGTIQGTVNDMNNDASETMVVYAYEKGSYSEDEGNGDFSNAVASSEVNSTNGDFSLNFLEAGEYELHFASYSEDDSTGGLSFQGMVDATAASELDLMGLNVDAQSETTVEVNVDGLLGL